MIRTKVLLGTSILFLLAGLIISFALKPPVAPATYVVLPTGAILFGLFLTSRLLEKESVCFDEEKHASDRSALDHHPAKAGKRRSDAQH